MTNYQVGDFLIKLKNASMAGIKDVEFRKTKLVLEVAKVLKEEGFVESVEEEKSILKIRLSIFQKKAVISNITIVSRPGLRIYMNVDEIEKYKKPDILILTTPKGVMSGRVAKKNRIGGELIAKVI